MRADRTRWRAILVPCVVAIVLIAGCGGGDDDGEAGPQSERTKVWFTAGEQF